MSELFNALNETEVKEISISSLAYLGDTVFDLFIRMYIIKNKPSTIDKQHKTAISCVNAMSQANAVKQIWDNLTQDEQELIKRGRNSKTGTTPKNMDIGDYKWATGLECLIGHLFICAKYERLDELFDKILKLLFKEEEHAD